MGKVFILEEGFSLLELSVAVGLAAILSGIAVTISPQFIADMRDTVNASSECSFERESIANKYLNGEEPASINNDCNLTVRGE